MVDANDLKIADIRSQAQTESAATGAAATRDAAGISAAARRYAADKGAAGSTAAARAAGAQALGPAASAAHDLWNDTISKFDQTGEPIPNSIKKGLKSQYRLPLMGVGPLFSQMIARGLSPQEAIRITQATVGKPLWDKWYSLRSKKFGI